MKLNNKVLSNGAILYNEKLCQYISKVADELLKDDLELRKKLRFYVLKSQSVNAFATDRGSIFITVGLLAQLENEAQLAFILSHEIIHYTNSHARTGYVENERIERGDGKYQRDNWNKELNKNKYSKELELEADVEGLKFYLKSNYTLEALHSVFYILQYAHIPIDDILFDTTYFNDTNFTLSSEYFKKELKAIEAIDDEDDQYLTHPNTNKRRSIVASEIEGKSNEGRVKFINSEKEFYDIQLLARFELSNLFTKDRKYAESFYNSYLLLKKYPTNKFLRTNIAYCLYALSKYRNDGKLHTVLTDYEKVQGQSQQVNYMFEKMEKKTLNTIAVKYLWELKQDFNDDEFIATIAKDALYELITESGARKLDYKKAFPIIEKENTIVKDSSNLSKYDKIIKNSETTENEIEYAFVNLFQNEEFNDLINKYEKEYVGKVKNGNEYEFENISERKKNKIGRALGIDKVVMVSPNYRRIDLRKRISEQYVFSESRKEDFISVNEFCAKKADVELKIISNTYFESTEKYNDMGLLNEWMGERFDHHNVHIYPYCKLFTDDLAKKYNTNYFGWTGMYSLRARKNNWGVIAASVALYGIGIPIGIYYAVTPENHTFYYTYLVDITNYDFLMSKEDYVKMKDYDDIMKSYIYDTYNQIKTQKDK
ncbi:MAG: M48 family metallopeptidase [Vicingaceae bacterium]|nr:M48 family metallopeptidase [Vicingaceae bacterium]